MARTGTDQCPVASGIILAVNVNIRGDARASMDEAGLTSYSQALLASMQVRPAHRAWQRLRHTGCRVYSYVGILLQAQSQLSSRPAASLTRALTSQPSDQCKHVTCTQHVFEADPWALLLACYAPEAACDRIGRVTL